MRLKEWLEKTEKKMNDHDGHQIYYVWNNKNTIITLSTIKRLPILLEADVVKEEEEHTEYMSFALDGTYTGEGKCIIYKCWIDNDEVEIAFKEKK